MTPAQLKEHYKSHGYSILAYTDHEFVVDHSDLADPDFLPITGMEYAVIQPGDYSLAKTVELNFYARDPHNELQVCFDKSTIYHGEKWRTDIVKLANGPYTKVFDMDNIQHVIDEARKYGYLVSLNHPVYSMITPEEFGRFEGLFAMEIWNSCSTLSGLSEYSPVMLDWMLRHGKKLFCLATDDCHGKNEPGDPGEDFGGWCMLKLDALNYDAAINALERGDFYASTGPEINDLYVEDGKVTITCSPARCINMITDFRYGKFAQAPKGGHLTEATFPIPPEGTFMRFEVIDNSGHFACSNPYPIAFH